MIQGINAKRLIADFEKVALIARVPISKSDILIEELPAPHKPPSKLPLGFMAVYIFSFRGDCLKVGKSGPRSQARYTSQHYNPKSAMSNLAKSLLATKGDRRFKKLNDENVSEWLKTNTDRVNLLLPYEFGISTLTLLEAFAQCRLKPIFEGFDSQKRGNS
jgi:hypothetical protein